MIEGSFKKPCLNCEDCSRKSELFRILSKEETSVLNEDRFEVNFRAGENIVKQGTILSHIVNLVHGTAKLYIEGYQERNLILSLAGSYSLLGGPGLFTDNRHHYTITALENSVVCFISTEKFRKVLHSNSFFNESFISHLNKRTIITFNKILSLTQKQMHGRMADAILYLSDEFFKSEKFVLPLNRQDLADMTAMSKDSAIRVLKEFERDGIVRIRNKTLEVIKHDALLELSEHG